MDNLVTDTAQNKRVLIVDDDPDARILVSIAVTGLGFHGIEAANGEEALTICERRLPDIAIVDRMMPGIQGTELCTKIKALPGGELVPVLLLTALDSVEEKVKAFAGGADDYVTKPFHIKELQARISALLRVRELNGELAKKNAQLREIQEILLEQERQLVVSQLAGTAAHQLGQPLSAILLNCHLLQRSASQDPRASKAIAAIVEDVKRMTELIDKLREADAKKTEHYSDGKKILDLEG